MEYLIKIKLIVSCIIVISVLSGYFWYFQKPIDNSTIIDPTPLFKDLPRENENHKNDEGYNNEAYIEEKINEFLIENPKTTKEYAQDIIYHDIAIKEKDDKICNKIKDEYWKEHCYRLLIQ